MKNNFTIRVYGICVNQKQELLLSDEIIYGRQITKFPGGGLQFGEGTVECLRREMQEETGVDFQIREHFYTTDFFVPSVFDPEIQVISIYYEISILEKFQVSTSAKPFDFIPLADWTQSFRWIPLSGLKKEDLTLPIDQHVAGLLLKS